MGAATASDGLEGEGAGELGLAGADRAGKDEVLSADEVASGQVVDLAGEYASLAGEVEVVVFKGIGHVKVADVEESFESSLVSVDYFGLEQAAKELEGGFAILPACS
jgi:hypothetical protein